MPNGSTTSRPPTETTDSPVDVHEPGVKKAVKKAVDEGKELVKDLADIVMRHQAPPGTPGLRKKTDD